MQPLSPFNLSFDEIPASPGVYLIVHRVTGDAYVGSSVNLRTRLMAHARTLKNGERSNLGLYTAAKKHGLLFDVAILEQSASDTFKAEHKWMERISPSLNRCAVPNSPPRHNAIVERPLNVDIPKDLMDRVKVAKVLSRKSIREIATEALEAWLRANGFTPEKMPKAKAK